MVVLATPRYSCTVYTWMTIFNGNVSKLSGTVHNPFILYGYIHTWNMAFRISCHCCTVKEEFFNTLPDTLKHMVDG